MRSIYRSVAWSVWTALLSLPVESALAQITINAQDFPGDQIGYSQNNLVGIGAGYTFVPVNVGAAGANQTWDFRQAASGMVPFTLSINAVAASNFAQVFPWAEVAITILPGFEVFCKKTTSNFLAFGFAYFNPQLGQLMVRACPSPLTAMPFPVTYGNGWSSEQACSNLVGLQESAGYFKSKDTVDGWGTIHLPAGSFPCLRIKSETQQQGLNAFTGLFETSTAIAYTWVAPGAYMLAYVESRPNESNFYFNQASVAIYATSVPIRPTPPPPQVTEQRVEPEPLPPAVPRQEPADTRNVRPVAPAPPRNLAPGTYHALILAVQDYQDDAIGDLEHPIQDAQKVVRALTANYTFEDQNLIFLQNPARKQIIDAFDQLSRRLGGNDNLLIFNAGHGYWDERLNQGFWLPADAQKDSRADWLSNGTIRDYIQGIKCKHTLLITDACFGGGIFKTRTAFSNAPRAITELYQLPSRKAMTSGTRNEVPDKSVFVEYLLKRLNENTDPFLNSQDLFTRFRDAVINNSPIGQVPQYGEIRETGDEGGDFVLVRRK